MMTSIFDLKPNKISTNLGIYQLVLMSETGDGKTTTMDKILREINTEKPPIFVTFEDRYQHIPGIIAVKVSNMFELEQVKIQLLTDQAKNMYSSVVIDAVDAMESMIEKYVADAKNVEISGDLAMGKGNKYIKNRMYFLDELRQFGWVVHFTLQSYRNEDIISKKVTYDIRLNKVIWDKVSQSAYAIGFLEKDSKDNRTISFRKNDMYPKLKDSFGFSKVKMPWNEIVKEMEKSIKSSGGKDFITKDDTIHIKKEESISFEQIKEKGNALGLKLFEHGKLDEAKTILRKEIGTNESTGEPLNFDSLQEHQMDLAKIVVLKLEDLCKKYKIQM